MALLNLNNFGGGLKGPPVVAADTVFETPISSAVSTAIPNGENGAKAKYVLLSSLNFPLLFRPIQTGETPASTTLAMLPARKCIVLNVAGYDALRLDQTALGTTHAILAPLENQ